jgi:hypothetical protein
LRARLGRAGRRDMERWSWRASTESLVGFYELALAVHGRFDRPGRRTSRA